LALIPSRNGARQWSLTAARLSALGLRLRKETAIHIAIDLRSPGERGILTYVRALLGSLLSADPENRFLLIKDPGFPTPDAPNVEVLPVPSTNPAHWLYWSNVKLPRLLAERRVDVYHTLKHVTAFRPGVPSILTCHGVPLVFLHAELQAEWQNCYWRTAYRCAARAYDGMICSTAAERAFVLERLGGEPERVDVVPLAAEPRFRRIEDRRALEEVRARHDLPERFLLGVGAAIPLKNTELLVRAFAAALPAMPGGWHLVLVGAADGAYAARARAEAERQGVADRVRFLGRLSVGLEAVYNLASAFVSPTLYESFGLAVVEAMAVGLPVLCSDIAELDDIVGEAALRFDPRDAAALAANMTRVAGDEALRRRLAAASSSRARQFSWERTAAGTLEVYARALRRRAGSGEMPVPAARPRRTEA
jgi:glycosyltransferase involved in cell wall biosynthesis